MNIKNLYELFNKYPSVSTDTRNIKPGSIFFALKGENFNGNAFAEKALLSGAVFAVVDEEKYVKDDRFILVNDVLDTLQQLALEHRKNLKIPFIGITGTNGKTTTKELFNIVLSKNFNTASTKGNLNNHIGVPLTILDINKNHEIAIIEMGANHPGEIAELCNITDPDFGIITNIGKAHLEGFLNIDNIIDTKTALYRHIKNKGGKIFVNCDNDLLFSLSEGTNRILFGSGDDSTIKGKILEMSPFITLGWGDNFENIVKTKLFGKYNFENILAAVCAGVYFGVSNNDINAAISEYTPNNNRSQIELRNGNTLILDAYNANPTSLSASLENFSDLKSKNKIVIIGDMGELGVNSDDEHKIILDIIKSKPFTQVFLIGKIFSKINTHNNFICFESADEGRQYFIKNKFFNSYILVKGSRFMQLEKIAEVL